MANKGLSNGYISSLCMELSLTMNAGISVSEGLALLEENEKDSYLREILTELIKKTDEGLMAGDAFGALDIFPKYMVNMIQIGEQTGNLDRVFKSLSEYYDRQESISSAVRKAIVFPSILFCMMMTVIAVLIIQVLPIFNDVFSQLGSTMSLIAMAFMAFGNALREGRFILLGIGALIVAICLSVAFIPALNGKFQSFKKKLSGKTKIGREIGTARFASAMSMSLQSGLGTDEALRMAEKLTEGTDAGKKSALCRDFLDQGENFLDAVNKAQLFDPIYCRMLAIGIRTGAADTVMEEIARRSEVRVNDNIERTIGKIEPAFVVVMSLLIGLVLLSVMLPMMGIMSSIG